MAHTSNFVDPLLIYLVPRCDSHVPWKDGSHHEIIHLADSLKVCESVFMQTSLANFSCWSFSLSVITLQGLVRCLHPLAPQLLHYHQQSLVEAGCQLHCRIINQIIKNMVWQEKETRPSSDSEAATMYKLKGQSSNKRAGQSFENRELVGLADLSSWSIKVHF